MWHTGDTPKILSNAEYQFSEQLFLQHGYYVKYLVRKKCSNPNDVEDFVQSTWEQLLKNSDKLRNISENKLSSYIDVVVTNVIRMEARKKKLDTCSFEDDLEPGYDPVPFLDQSFDQKQVKEIFRNAWSQIDPYVREILVRRYIMEQSGQEIADAMQISPNSVRSYLYRARKVAKRELLKNNRNLDQQWHDAYT